ncbi:MAG: hypothetical protein KDI92_02030 [Xanthomonadales bacterium]|nr:hypothetical protein [Xanthomonadales bacterium]
MKKTMYKLVALGSLMLSANVFAQCDDTNFNAWTDAREDQAGSLEATAPGMAGTACKMSVQALVDRDQRARVQDQSPQCESSYRSRFMINADNMGQLATNERNKVYNAQCRSGLAGHDPGVTCSNTGVVQLKLQGNDTEDANIFRSFVIDEGPATAADNRRKFDVVVNSGDQAFEMQYIRASAPGAADGVFRLWANGNTNEASPDIEFTDLQNYNTCIDAANLGSVGPNNNFVSGTAGAVLNFDEFESRRQTGIGVN